MKTINFTHTKPSGEQVTLQVMDVNKRGVLYRVLGCEASPARIARATFTAFFGHQVLAGA